MGLYDTIACDTSKLGSVS